MNGKVRSVVVLLTILALVVILLPLSACNGNDWGIILPPSTTGTLILDDVMPSPDGAILFLSTTFISSGGTFSILWKSPVPGCFGSWSWTMLNIAFTPDWIIRLSPDYASDSTLYWCDRGGTDIMRSVDGGVAFASRVAPTPIIDVAVEDSSTLYLADGSNVYKSTNGGWVWGLPVNANIGTIFMLAMAPTYPMPPVPGHVLVGGSDGAASFSTDGAASFVPFLPTLPVGGDVQMAGDASYASNNIVYAGSSSGNVYRWVFPGGPWVAINSTITSVSGLAVNNIGLCASDATPGGGAYRTTNPTVLSPNWNPLINGLSGGETFNVVPSALRCFDASSGNFDLFAIDTTGNELYRYND